MRQIGMQEFEDCCSEGTGYRPAYGDWLETEGNVLVELELADGRVLRYSDLTDRPTAVYNTDNGS